MSDAMQPNSDEAEECDLNWLAFRYVSGELTGEELAEFEECSGRKPAGTGGGGRCRAAGARSIALAGTKPDRRRMPTAIGSRQPILDRGPAWRWRLAWALVGRRGELALRLGAAIWRDSGRALNPVRASSVRGP